ncbi:MAG: ParB family transcriptional regulator, chromosome partitioning protein, partial [Actinoplanes sp.]|nr:ParB family transcriptional regulator, chromosome partitioning protein [Actinoplanes sp.]
VDFTTTEQAQMYAQLSLLDGWDADRIAAFTTRPVEQVRAAISLTTMPAAAKAAADTGQLDLDDVAVLQEFTTDPSMVAKVLQRGSTSGWGLKHVIADEQSKAQAKDALELCKAGLVVAGVKVVKAPKNWPYGDQTMMLAKDLQDQHGNRLDPEQVKTKPGFAAIVNRGYGGAEPKVDIVCTDPQAWGYAPAAGTNQHARAEREAQEDLRRQYMEAFAVATGVRWQFLARTYGSAKTAKALYLTVLRDALIDPDTLKYPEDKLHDLVGKLAGAPLDVDKVTAAGIDRLTRMLVARWLCHAEDNLVRLANDATWGVDPQAGVDYLDTLVDAKYELSEAETSLRDDLVRNTADPDQDDLADADMDGGPDDDAEADDTIQVDDSAGEDTPVEDPDAEATHADTQTPSGPGDGELSTVDQAVDSAHPEADGIGESSEDQEPELVAA